MALISLEGMRFRAHHGLYEEERILGNDFILDVFIDTNIEHAQTVLEHDIEKMTNTVNYEIVYDICRFEMGKPQKLLETVIQEIIYKLKRHFTNMLMVTVKLRKANPPLGGQVEYAIVTEIKRFQKECAKCNDPMICYKEGKFNDQTCWCEQGAKNNIHPRTIEILAQRYKEPCLCPKCLKEFEG